MQPCIVYHDAREVDVIDIARRLRKQDLDELEVLLPGKTPVQALLVSMNSSVWTRVALINGHPECVFGLGRDGATGIPWMMGTDVMMRHQRALLVEGRAEVEAMQRSCALLYNVTHARNTAAIRWLKRLGFQFGDQFDHNGHPLLPFYRHQHV